MKCVHFVIAFACTLGALPLEEAKATCREDPRRVEFGDGKAATFKTLNCTTRDGGRLRVEFADFNSTAAGELITGTRHPAWDKFLHRSIVQKNDVFERLLHIYTNYGIKENFQFASHSMAINLTRGKNDETSQNNIISEQNSNTTNDTYSRAAVLDLRLGLDYYPAINEIRILDKGIIPENMKIYYELDDIWNSYLNKSVKSPSAVFWRYVKIDDFRSFYINRSILNVDVKKNVGLKNLHGGVEDIVKYGRGIDKISGLFEHLSRSKPLPENFAILRGHHFSQGCDDSGWEFTVEAPTIHVNVAILRNEGSRPMKLGSFRSNHDQEIGLHKAPNWSSMPTSTERLDVELAPGAALIIPVSIMFVPNTWNFKNTAGMDETATMKRLRSKGINVRDGAYGMPQFDIYHFDGGYNLIGLEVDGDLVSFLDKSLNYIELSHVVGIGSCPYLLVSEYRSQIWHDYGKIIDQADSPSKATSQEVVFPGFVDKIAIEEREPEIATITAIDVAVKLNSGQVVSLEISDRAPFRETKILWGEVMKIAVPLPTDIRPEDVENTKISVSGYYERYSKLRAASAESPSINVYFGD